MDSNIFRSAFSEATLLGSNWVVQESEYSLCFPLTTTTHELQLASGLSQRFYSVSQEQTAESGTFSWPMCTNKEWRSHIFLTGRRRPLLADELAPPVSIRWTSLVSTAFICTEVWLPKREWVVLFWSWTFWRFTFLLQICGSLAVWYRALNNLQNVAAWVEA